MTQARRDVALAIGIANAKGLDYLGGAVNGAHAFHNWAAQCGYDSRLLTDEEQPVTIPRLRVELESLLAPPGEKIHRLLLYFAGHGLIREAEEALWLLSDWHVELRAVAVEALKRRIYMHNVEQIAIFADSCRTLPPNIVVADLCADFVLGRGPVIGPKKHPAIDKFVAAQDGSATFMVPGDAPTEDRCLFSGLLLESLWGLKPEAFSPVQKDKITSRSLGTYLETEVPRLAERYQRQLFPVCSPTFPDGDDIYFGAEPRPAPPVFPPWPPPERIALVAAAAAGDQGAHFGMLKETVVPTLGQSSRMIDLLERARQQQRADAVSISSGVATEGRPVKALWTAQEIALQAFGRANLWGFVNRSDNWLHEAVPVLVEFDNGLFAATTAIPGFVATIACEDRGASALLYRSEHEPIKESPAEAAIAAMENGALRSSDVTDLAVKLRQMKHIDPVLGVISAYLYDAIGDVDNIRRMAYYYVQHGQAIPYDIVLLAQIRGQWRGRLLWVDVPAVERKVPRTKAEARNGWTYGATTPVSGPVAGVWPWMRQGWSFLEDPIDVESTVIAPGLTEAIPYLSAARFATVTAAGAALLARIFGLNRRVVSAEMMAY
jgi:hypothetical protein